ncbi:IclR family transcriptional regulator C-terminal domain-containing protein, partial [Paenibacillus polymyxa]|nr:IclR family transcriptional regulator C-terminal domain-containing protein [Paenibacillus polymyxa]
SRLPATLTSLPALREALGAAAAQGYAIDNEENEPGIVCYGGALCDGAGRPVATAGAVRAAGVPARPHPARPGKPCR